MPLSETLRCWFLQSRQEYQTCHIRLPDGESLGAIAINQGYYSFRRRLDYGAPTLRVLYTISDRMDDVALTDNGKWFFLWGREQNALPTSRIKPMNPDKVKPVTFAKLPTHYEFAKIKVPDLDQVLSAVAHDGKYYSLFKLETDPMEVLAIVAKLSSRGDELLVALGEEGYAICVLEAEAFSAQPR